MGTTCPAMTMRKYSAVFAKGGKDMAVDRHQGRTSTFLTFCVLCSSSCKEITPRLLGECLSRAQISAREFIQIQRRRL